MDKTLELHHLGSGQLLLASHSPLKEAVTKHVCYTFHICISIKGPDEMQAAHGVLNIGHDRKTGVPPQDYNLLAPLMLRVVV